MGVAITLSPAGEACDSGTHGRFWDVSSKEDWTFTGQHGPGARSNVIPHFQGARAGGLTDFKGRSLWGLFSPLK